MKTRWNATRRLLEVSKFKSAGIYAHNVAFSSTENLRIESVLSKKEKTLWRELRSGSSQELHEKILISGIIHLHM